MHLTELAHHKVTDPSEALTISQKVDAQVINIDVDERRIGLSVKALKPIDKETMERLKTRARGGGSEACPACPSEVRWSGRRREQNRRGKRVQRCQGCQRIRGDQGSSKVRKGFVASKTGKKYYPTGSAAAEKIKEENRVMFATEEEAKAAGARGLGRERQEGHRRHRGAFHELIERNRIFNSEVRSSIL